MYTPYRFHMESLSRERANSGYTCHIFRGVWLVKYGYRVLVSLCWSSLVCIFQGLGGVGFLWQLGLYEGVKTCVLIHGFVFIEVFVCGNLCGFKIFREFLCVLLYYGYIVFAWCCSWGRWIVLPHEGVLWSWVWLLFLNAFCALWIMWRIIFQFVRLTPYYSRSRLVCTVPIVRIYRGWGSCGKVASI